MQEGKRRSGDQAFMANESSSRHGGDRGGGRGGGGNKGIKRNNGGGGSAGGRVGAGAREGPCYICDRHDE